MRRTLRSCPPTCRTRWSRVATCCGGRRKPPGGRAQPLRLGRRADGDKPEYRRRRSALRFERVLSCKCRDLNPAGQDAVLNLLAVEFAETDSPAGVVTLIFLRRRGAAARSRVPGGRIGRSRPDLVRGRTGPCGRLPDARGRRREEARFAIAHYSHPAMGPARSVPRRTAGTSPVRLIVSYDARCPAQGSGVSIVRQAGLPAC